MGLTIRTEKDRERQRKGTRTERGREPDCGLDPELRGIGTENGIGMRTIRIEIEMGFWTGTEWDRNENENQNKGKRDGEKNGIGMENG